MRALRRYLPTPEQLRKSRSLAWLAPAFGDPRLWAFRRRSVAIGLAVGVFFGLLIPVAQILFAVLAAVVLRANVAVAAVTTLVTNPFTFAPIYYLAYKVGAAVLGDPATLDAAALAHEVDTLREWLAHWWEKFAEIGKPLALGLALFAVVGAAAGYALVQLAWRARVALHLRRRRRRAVVS